MKTIRKGNDIVVRWRIFRYGQKYDIALYRESISLVLSNMGEKKEITDYSIVDVNTIVFKYRAEDQGLGIYRLLLIDKSRNSTRIIEECNAFRLVNTSDAANNDDTLESTITITLTSELTAPADGLSAYEVALQNGFVGTEEEWLQSLVPDTTDIELAEAQRQAKELDRISAEEQRTSQENERAVNEQERQEAEQLRKTSESNRSLAEDTRNASEQERNANETSRMSAEEARNEKEQERQSNEQLRQDNESVRQAKELERIEAENIRQSSEVERQNALTEATASANAAANNANEAASSAQQKAAEANEAAVTAQQKAEEANNASVSANAAASNANNVVEEFNSIIVQETGNSQDKVMSQKAVTDAMTASQAKLTELGQKVTDLEDKTDTTIVHTKNLADYASVMVGLLPDMGGTISRDAQVKSIKFSCKPSTTYTISKVVTKRFRVAYYNTDPVFMTHGAGVITSNAASAITITTAADSSYIVAFIYDGSVETLTMDEILASLQIEEGSVATSYETPGWTAIDKVARENNTTIEERIKTTEESVSNNSDNIKELQEILTNTTRGLETTDVVTGKYRTISGNLETMSSYFYSNPILLHKGDRITTDTAIPTYQAVSYITQVDEENNFIEVLKPGTKETEIIDFTIPRDGYFSISALNSQIDFFVIYLNGIESRIDGIMADVSSVFPAADTRLPAISNNPLSSIRRDAGYGAIIRKWGIIGDSLSSGEMQCYNSESSSPTDYKFIDMYQYSWGQVFARLIGAEAYNFSNGGQTTWGWLKGQGVIHDNSYIGGIGGGDWDLAKQDAYKKDAYIIALGVNDRLKIANGEYVLGATSQIVSYDGTYSDIDDTSVNPKSFVRYYAGIIQRVKSIQPKAKIFCVTPLGSNYAEIAQAIRDIVEYYSSDGVYLIDLFNYIPEGYNVDGYMLNGHLSPMGYAYTAYMMNTYIDWIIRNNGSAFRDTALIGTEYRPDYY